MRIVATSDLHGVLPPIDQWPDGDVLVLAGDTSFLEVGATRWRGALDPQIAWLLEAGEKYRHVVGIAGNYDREMEANPEAARELPWTYLQDEAVELDGVRFYGTPWSVTFFDGAFMRPDADLAERWALIPADVDVLVVHGPAHGLLDATSRGPCGSRTLRERLRQVRPRLTIHGHIHEARGVVRFGGRPVANVAWNGLAPAVFDLK